MRLRNAIRAALFTLYCGLCTFPTGAKDAEAKMRETVKIGIFDLAPFMMELDESAKEGTVGGAAADYWKELIAPLMNADVEVSGPYPIPRLEKMLETGEIDVIPYITKIPARESKFLYPATPLTRIYSCIIVKKDSSLTAIKSQEDLFGLTIGFITNAYTPPIVLHDRITLDVITTTEFRQTNHQKLMNGRVDALLDINVVSFIYEMKRKGNLDSIRIIRLKDEGVPIYSIFAKSPRGENLRSHYDAAAARLPKGSFDKIVERYVR